MNKMIPVDLQVTNEYHLAKKHLDKYITQAIEQDPALNKMVIHGVELLTEWVAGNYYASKNSRLAQLDKLMFESLVREVFTGITYCQFEELFVSVTAQLASRLQFSDKIDAITTMAEIVAVLWKTGAYDIMLSAYGGDQLVVVNKIQLPQGIHDAIERSECLPPMVSKPSPLMNNYQSPYLTFNECQILGRGNGHTEDICLDVLNTLNQQSLCLDLEFLKTVAEPRPASMTDPQQLQQWTQFTKVSNYFYHLMLTQNNEFWLTYQPDKRGRIYANGYHINTQGSAYKKAMVELKHQEHVLGVPT